MKKRSRNLVAGTVLMAIAGSALAFGGGFGPGGYGPGGCDNRGGQMGPMPAFSQLDLTAEQRTQLRDLRRSQRDAMEATRDAMRDNRRALRDATEAGADEATIKKLAEERGALVTTMTVQRNGMHQRMRAILTEAQREQLEERGFGYGGGRHHNHQPRHGW